MLSCNFPVLHNDDKVGTSTIIWKVPDALFVSWKNADASGWPSAQIDMMSCCHAEHFHNMLKSEQNGHGLAVIDMI